MPALVQFRNGRQIVNTYSADGRKLKSRYYTPIPGMFSPITVAEGSVFKISGYPDYFFDMEATAYVGNKEYEATEPKHYHYLGLSRIKTSEGYVKQGKYHYYRRDHLGNNREVWQVNANTIATVQRTNYYPSGLPWAYKEGDGASVQPDKFNGCEYIEMHGYDVTDLGNRGVHNAKGRFDTMDRFAEKFPWQSSYVHAGNNPVNYVDVNGDSIWIEQRKGFLGLGGKETLRYENGNLYNKDGTDYAGKVKGFLNKTMTALNTIGEFDSGKDMLN